MTALTATPEPLTVDDPPTLPDYALGDRVHSSHHGPGVVSYESDSEGPVVFGVTYRLTSEYGCPAVLRARGVVPTGGRVGLPVYPAGEPGGHGTSRGTGYCEHETRRHLPKGEA